MGHTIMGAVVSLDGYIAHDDDGVGPLFDWYGNGDVEWAFSADQERPCRTTQASRDFIQAVYPRIGAEVVGRRLFDHTNGWGGVPVAGDHVFVVTHALPTDWEHAGSAPFTFVTDGVEAAITQARELAGPDRVIDVTAGEIGGAGAASGPDRPGRDARGAGGVRLGSALLRRDGPGRRSSRPRGAATARPSAR
jgi:dihydrofolate reductase